LEELDREGCPGGGSGELDRCMSWGGCGTMARC